MKYLKNYIDRLDESEKDTTPDDAIRYSSTIFGKSFGRIVCTYAG